MTARSLLSSTLLVLLLLLAPVSLAQADAVTFSARTLDESFDLGDGAAVVVGDSVFAVTDTDGRIFRVDPETGAAEEMKTRLPDGFVGVSLAAAGDRIYVFGGTSCKDGATAIGSCTRILEYDPEVDSAQLLAARLPTGRAYAPAVTVDGKIYVLGGRERVSPSAPDRALDEIVEFDPATKALRVLDAKLPTGSGRLFAAGALDSIYVLRTGETIHRFFPEDGTVAPLNATAPGAATPVWTGRALHLVGATSRAPQPVWTLEPDGSALVPANGTLTVRKEQPVAVFVGGEIVVMGSRCCTADDTTTVALAPTYPARFAQETPREEPEAPVEEEETEEEEETPTPTVGTAPTGALPTGQATGAVETDETPGFGLAAAVVALALVAFRRRR